MEASYIVTFLSDYVVAPAIWFNEKQLPCSWLPFPPTGGKITCEEVYLARVWEIPLWVRLVPSWLSCVFLELTCFLIQSSQDPTRRSENIMLEQPPGHLFGSETRFQQNWLPGWHEVWVVCMWHGTPGCPFTGHSRKSLLGIGGAREECFKRRNPGKIDTSSFFFSLSSPSPLTVKLGTNHSNLWVLMFSLKIEDIKLLKILHC